MYSVSPFKICCMSTSCLARQKWNFQCCYFFNDIAACVVVYLSVICLSTFLVSTCLPKYLFVFLSHVMVSCCTCKAPQLLLLQRYNRILIFLAINYFVFYRHSFQQTSRNCKKLFNEARERATKALGFAKVLRKVGMLYIDFNLHCTKTDILIMLTLF